VKSQTSKISINSVWMIISLWVLKIQGFEGGIGVPKHGRPLNSTRTGLLYHQTSKNSPIFAEEEEEEDTTKLGEVQELGTEILEVLLEQVFGAKYVEPLSSPRSRTAQLS
jgi:hypothetical protein